MGPNRAVRKASAPARKLRLLVILVNTVRRAENVELVAPLNRATLASGRSNSTNESCNGRFDS